MAVASVEVHKPGIQSTIQDHPGRVGYLAKGFFPAGPMDELAFRAANMLVGNDAGRPAVEVTLGEHFAAAVQRRARRCVRRRV